ncbi:MAG: hypothetical protein CL678_11835 [Bdellovibrionaceae bacterium]|nr:hypothetical protein [Pseudobdellovibrionaceae bacterium]
MQFEVAPSHTLPVLKFDGGSTHSFNANELDADTLYQCKSKYPDIIGRIIRYDHTTQKLTCENKDCRALGIVVAWSSDLGIGAYQYDGAVTIKVWYNTNDYYKIPWSLWNQNFKFDSSNISKHSAVGYVLAHRHNIFRIQIEPH